MWILQTSSSFCPSCRQEGSPPRVPEARASVYFIGPLSAVENVPQKYLLCEYCQLDGVTLSYLVQMVPEENETDVEMF